MYRIAVQCLPQRRVLLRSLEGIPTNPPQGVLSSYSLNAISDDHRQARWHKAISNAEKIVGKLQKLHYLIVVLN